MKQILLTLCFLIMTSFMFGQTKKIENVKVSSTKVVFLGKSKPIVDLIEKEATSVAKKDKYKKDKKVPDNFRNRLGKNKVIFPELEHQGIDPVWQSSHTKKFSSAEPLVNIDGLNSNFGSPHDPTISVGNNYVLQAINSTRIGVWDKDGNPVTEFNMNTLWSEFGASSEGDPIVLFDQEAGQWMLTEFTDPANLLIAISETSDPLGSYFAYTFSTPSFPDYPKYGIWSEHYVVTTNEGGSGTLTQYFIERDSLLQGAEARMQQVEITGTFTSEQGFITSTPVDWEGINRPVDSRPIVLKLNDSSWGEVSQDAVELYRFSIDYEEANNTEVESLLINTSAYDSYPCAAAGLGFACVPQPNGAGLDAVPEVIMNAPQYRNFGTHESIVLSFVTDVNDGLDHAGVRWMELRKSGTEDWNLYQEGSYAPDTNHRFLSGIAIDKKGNIGLAYNVSSDSVFAGIRYTGRYETDPLGEMTIPEVSVIEGNSTLNTGGRFADYSQIAVDPVDESTFWYTSEYASNGTSRTRIVSFQLSQDTFDMSVRAIVSPNSSFDLSATESVVIEINNNGLTEAQAYDITLSLEGTLLETISIVDPLASGAQRSHTFESIIDMSQVGDYNLTAAIIYPDDQNPNNNVVTKTVTQRTAINATLMVNGPLTNCNIATLINITIGNEGGIPLTDATIDFYIAGVLVDTEDWTGNLGFGESERFDFLLNNIPDGESDYEIVLTHGAGEDLLPDNNTVIYSINSIGPDGLITLQILTDFYSEETSWFLYEQGTNNVILSGGDYEINNNLYEEELCLDPNGCYTFEMLDEYGDGLCCGFGEGNYGLYNGQGQAIFTSTGEFGDSEITNFCASDIDCAISVETEVQDVATDGTPGSIMVFPSGGVAPYSYSIDNGATTQESNVFDNLQTGDYTIIIYSADQLCEQTVAVTVGIILSTESISTNNLKINATPNPNEGFFDLSIENYQSNKVFIHFTIYNSEGRLIQSRRMANYSGVYITQVSLLDYPDGNYFIRFLDENINELVKIIKM